MRSPTYLLALLLALAGAAPAAAHDVDGDGRADIAVLGHGSHPQTATVALGGPRAGTLRRESPGGRGFLVRTRAGLSSVEPAGDLDGDGLSELLALDAGVDGRWHLFVVWGRTDPGDVDLDVPSPAWAPVDLRGQGVIDAAPAGDVDGDGLADLVIAHGQRPTVSVVRGARDRGGLSLAARAFSVRVRPSTLVAPEGRAVRAAGDVDGDGAGDLLVDYDLAVYCGEGDEGCGSRRFVVFGGAREDVEITGRLRTGFSVRGASGRARGFEIAGADALGPGGGAVGDFDGDGLADVAVTGFLRRGDAVVHGRRGSAGVRRPSPLRPAAWRRWRDGLGLFGTATGTDAAAPPDLCGPGDVTGDGRADVIAGEARGRALRVVGGRRGRGLLRLGRRRTGMRLLLPRAPRSSWERPALSRCLPAGDVDGDGAADLAVEVAIPRRNDARPPRRRTFVVYGPLRGRPVALTALGARGFEVR